jgi:hypothetical protein
MKTHMEIKAIPYNSIHRSSMAAFSKIKLTPESSTSTKEKLNVSNMAEADQT